MPDFLSPGWITTVKAWIDACCQQEIHETCGTPDPGWLPTRLIDVDPHYSTPSQSHVRLVETKDNDKIKPNPGFAALSYCWGKGRAHELNKSASTTDTSRSRNLNRMELSTLPRTIRDAVRVCRALSIPYLWVDSICIIQENTTDFEQEAPTMAKVYGNSVFTISAVYSPDCTSGFLHHIVRLDWKRLESEVGHNIILYRGDDIDWEFMLSRYAPLAKRGWTLQERALSSRVLHFGTRTCWECRNLQVPELWSVQSTGDSIERQEEMESYARHMMPRLVPHTIPDSVGRPWLNQYWSHIIMDFSRRDLSHPRDKLPALEGLARRLQSQMAGDIYLSGLWASYLVPEGLLWSRDPYEPAYLVHAQTTESNEPRAPSWSWAAYDGEIVTIDTLWTQLITQRYWYREEVRLATKAPESRLTSYTGGRYRDSIEVKGPLAAVTSVGAVAFGAICKDYGDIYELGYQCFDGLLMLSDDGGSTEPLQHPWIAVLDETPPTELKRKREEAKGDWDHRHGITLDWWILRMESYTYEKTYEGSSEIETVTVFSALILEQQSGNGNVEFKRKGVAYAYRKDGAIPYPKKWKLAQVRII